MAPSFSAWKRALPYFREYPFQIYPEDLSAYAGSSEENGLSEVPEAQDESSVDDPVVPNKRKVYSSGYILDDNLQPVGRERRPHPLLRGIILTLVTLILLLTAGSYILHRIIPGFDVLGAPENAVSGIFTPIQSFFSTITESVAGYFRSMKLRLPQDRQA